MARPKKKASKKAPRIAKPARAARPRTRKAKDEADAPAGPGHNLTSIKKLIGPFFLRYNRLLNEKDSTNAAFMSDARVLIEDAANSLGASKSIVRMALQDKRRDLKREAKEKEMNPGDVDTLHTFQAALGVMPTKQMDMFDEPADEEVTDEAIEALQDELREDAEVGDALPLPM